MEDGAKEEEPLSFIALGAVTLNVIRYLVKEQQINGETKERRKTSEADDKHASSKLPIVRI